MLCTGPGWLRAQKRLRLASVLAQEAADPKPAVILKQQREIDPGMLPELHAVAIDYGGKSSCKSEITEVYQHSLEN
jgi:hypothetical protein